MIVYDMFSLCVCLQVIVRRDDKIMLFCKGADSIIYERLSKHSLDMKEITASHLDVCYIVKSLSRAWLRFQVFNKCPIANGVS